MRAIYWAWSMVLFALVVVQVGLAGSGAFYVANKLSDEGSTTDEDVFFDSFFSGGFFLGDVLVGGSFLRAILVSLGSLLIRFDAGPGVIRVDGLNRAGLILLRRLRHKGVDAGRKLRADNDGAKHNGRAGHAEPEQLVAHGMILLMIRRRH